MVGRCLDEIEHVIDSNTGEGTQKSKDHLDKYQTLGMYPKVGVRACNKNFAQHLLSYHPATNEDKRNLWILRYSCQRAPEQSINTLWIHGDEDQTRQIPWPGTLGYSWRRDRLDDTRRLT